MPKKNHESYSLFKRNTPAGKTWYVKFWNCETGKYAEFRSLGVPVEGRRERRREAEEAARALLPEIKFTSANKTLFLEYVENFWQPESKYCREAANLKKKPLSLSYIKMNHDAVRCHLRPFSGFNGLALNSLTAGIIKDWQLWENDRGMSERKINIVLQAMRVAVRYAYEREEIKNDPFKNVKPLPEKQKEKGVLTPRERLALIKSEAKNPRWRLAVLLGCLCGMRRGEVRGLQWGDIGEGIITIQHNWIDGEGLKSPKCGSARVVPYSAAVLAALDNVRSISKNIQPDSFVFEQFGNSEQPVAEQFFRHALDQELSAIGIPGEWPRWKKRDKPEGYVNEQKRRNLTYHSLRHTYITLGQTEDGFSNLEIQALAGHHGKETIAGRNNADKMTGRYTHAGQVIDMKAARAKLDAVLQKATG